MTAPLWNSWIFYITVERKSSCDTFFLRYFKKYYQLPILGTLNVWTIPSKTIIPTCRNFDVHLHAKKWTPSLTFFWDWKKIENLLFWELRECSTIPIKNHSIKFVGNFHAYQTFNFITLFLLKTLLRNSELVILSTLGMPSYTHPKCYNQLVENLFAYLMCLSAGKK